MPSRLSYFWIPNMFFEMLSSVEITVKHRLQGLYAYDTTSNYLAGEVIYKCKNKACNINPGCNEHHDRPLWCGLRLEKVKHRLLCKLTNVPMQDLNMISILLNEMRVLGGGGVGGGGQISLPGKHLKNFQKNLERGQNYEWQYWWCWSHWEHDWEIWTCLKL